MMLFFISFKYSLMTIIRSRMFVLLSLITLFVMFTLNLSFGLYIRISEKQIRDIFDLDYINVVILLISLTGISIFFSNELLYAHKRNGIKTIEVKNGVKIWAIFFSRVLALLTVLFSLSIILTTIVVVENLIIFNENIYVTKLVFVNLYLIFLVPIFLLALNILIISLNWGKMVLIFSGVMIGFLCPFHLFSSTAYDFTPYAEENRGSNNLGFSRYKVYFNYYIDKYRKSNDNENSFVKELSKFGEDQLNISAIIEFEGERLDEQLKEYYKNFIEDSYFYSSGNLFYNIDLFNSLNEKYLVDPTNYVKLEYNENLINDSELFRELFEFDIKKTNLNIFEDRTQTYNLVKPASIFKELKTYISQLEKKIYSNSNLEVYYDDLIKINNFVLEMYQKGFYFRNEHFFLHNSISSVGKEYQEFFTDPFNEQTNYVEQAKELFELQTNSTAKSIYQGILFYIINNYRGDKIDSNPNTPSRFTPTPSQMANYYTSPFLWLEHLTKYAFVPKNYGNIILIDSASFIGTNNMFKVDYSVRKAEESAKEFLEIKDYIYKGTNTTLLVFLIILYSLIVLAISYIIYRFNFYK